MDSLKQHVMRRIKDTKNTMLFGRKYYDAKQCVQVCHSTIDSYAQKYITNDEFLTTKTDLSMGDINSIKSESAPYFTKLYNERYAQKIKFFFTHLDTEINQNKRSMICDATDKNSLKRILQHF
eukprot:UN28449